MCVSQQNKGGVGRGRGGGGIQKARSVCYCAGAYKRGGEAEMRFLAGGVRGSGRAWGRRDGVCALWCWESSLGRFEKIFFIYMYVIFLFLRKGFFISGWEQMGCKLGTA